MLFEKFMFKKIEVWAVLLMMVFLVVGFLLFAGLVRHYLREGATQSGFGYVVERIAAFPSAVKGVFF